MTHFRSQLSIARPNDLDFDLSRLTLNVVRVQLSYQFWCLWNFSFSSNGPTPVRRTTSPGDLDLWPWLSWRLSLIRVFVLHLWYEVWISYALSYDTLSVLALIGLVTLTFWPRNWCVLLHMGCATLLPMSNFVVSEIFRCRVMGQGQHPPDGTRNFATLTLEVIMLIGDTGLRFPCAPLPCVPKWTIQPNPACCVQCLWQLSSEKLHHPVVNGIRNVQQSHFTKQGSMADSIKWNAYCWNRALNS